MKRDWDLIREILVALEDKKESKGILRLKDFPSGREQEISYHVALLLDAGLVEGSMPSEFGPPVKRFNLSRLTWEGHDFLDAIRNDDVWSKIKTKLARQQNLWR